MKSKIKNASLSLSLSQLAIAVAIHSVVEGGVEGAAVGTGVGPAGPEPSDGGSASEAERLPRKPKTFWAWVLEDVRFWSLVLE